MSVETVPFSHDTSINFEESTEERRVRLHHESASICQALHELETHYNTLTLGLIAIAQSGYAQASEEEVEKHRTLAQDIVKLRQEQAQLIIDIANCNRTIWRPPYNKPKEIAERARIEHPYVVQIYNGGEDPLTKDVYDRYLPGLAE